MMQNDNQDYLDNYKIQKVAGLYNIGKTIGKGHFAVVKEARHVFTQEKVAIKIIDKTQLDQISKDQLLSEVMCMKLVQHPNIIRLYEVIDTVNKLYLILELGDGGDLYDYITNNGYNGLREEEAKRYFRQIIRAIGYCHKLHVVHRDIKPENVVFFKDLELVKLTDFGFSNKFVPGGTLSTSCGSLAYSAPEILLGDSYDAPKVDIWSLGVILYMIVVGSLPFNETNDSETVAKIMDCKYNIPNYVSSSCQSLIRKMLVRDAAKRATLDEIIEDNWLKVDVNDVEYELETYSVPLLNQEQLSFEEHIEILTKMSDEKLAPVQEIQRILDNDEYNHISATYFLLAERKLKRRFVEEYVELKARHVKTEKDTSQVLEKQKSIVQNQNFDATRRISMILEGEENEENEAITSLAIVKRELDSFVSENEGIMASNTNARNSSRCVSRISSVIDLHSLSDEYESDTGSAAIRPRLRLLSVTHRPHSPVGTEIVVDKDRKGKIFTQYPIMMNQITNIKKSFSVTDISERKETNIEVDNTKNNVHKFSIGSSTPRYSSNSAKYMEIRKIALNERRSIQVFFDNSSNSTTANCSSPENSDIEIDFKSKIKSSNKKVEKQLSDLDYREVCEPIHEEDEVNRSKNVSEHSTNRFNSDCYRSQSFDGRLRNSIQLDCASSRGILPLKLKHKSPSNSWHRNSLCNHLADSNFSLTSLASKLDNPNMMQVIRGTFELHLRNSTSATESVSHIKSIVDAHTTEPPTPNKSTNSKKDSSIFSPKLRPRNIYKQLRTTLPKFKKQKLYILSARSNSKTPILDHSAISCSTSCQVLSSEKTQEASLLHNIIANSNSIPQFSSSNYSDPKSVKTESFFGKRNNMACCSLS